ncbi:MAG: succinylglutamate desuccinylase/aspartoacylase family protein [Alphaproteobacteria bacterium]|nr:succinylglutamate desuccinylase/aspartoacylase family protein [Alphaproteobacteria bacterium]
MNQPRGGIKLHRFDEFPTSLIDVAASDLWQHLPGPSLFEIPGRDPRPLFVSALLHGNEDTGWSAIQKVLRHYADRPLPRRLILFVGNIEAAKCNVRTLDNQTDYNRAWPGTRYPEAAEAALMREVVEYVAAAKPFASIDIHNNTGNNPRYACVNDLDERFLHLACLFSRTVVFFTRPVGVQSAAMATVCPAVTVECGVPGTPAATDHAARFVDAALHMTRFPDHPVPDCDIDLLQTAVILRVPPDATFTYDGEDADFRFLADLDHLNFSELEPGTKLGQLGGNGDRRLAVVPGGEFDAAAETYLDYPDGEIQLARRAIPAMLTLDPRAVRLDCLGYLMHRINRTGERVDND